MLIRRICPTFLLALGLVFTAPVSAQSDRDAFVGHFRDKLDVGLEKRSGEAVDRVFRGRIFRATLKFDVEGLGQHSFLAARHDGEVLKLESGNSPGDMPNLTSLVDPGFRIESRADAETFEDALNALYLGKFDDEENLHLVNKGGEWVFVRGEAFGDYKGFIVGTDDSGAVTGIRFEMELPVTEADLQS